MCSLEQNLAVFSTCTMKGVNIPAVNGINGKHYPAAASVGRKSRSILVRPAISRGRGYAIMLIREEFDDNENICIKPAPRTSTLVRKGRFHSTPASASFASLPESIMVQICSYMDDAKSVMTCAMVCKEWRRVILSAFDQQLIKCAFDLKLTRSPLRVKKIFDTTKLKIFCKCNGTRGIETTAQRKDNASFREVSVKFEDAGEGNIDLLSFLARLVPFLTPTKAFLLSDIELNDSLLNFLVAWQPRLTELRFLRCSLWQVSTVGMQAILKSRRLRHLYIDNCPVSVACPLANPSTLTDISKVLTHIELCFSAQSAITSDLLDDNFLISVAQSWKTKSDIRWMKLSNAPKITTCGVETLVQAFFKLRYSSKAYYADDKKDFIKASNLVLWLRDTAFDPDEFLKRPLGRRWFRDDKLPTSWRRKLRDNYGGEDVIIWKETTIPVTEHEKPPVIV